jgi:hypothetical protein
VGTIALFENRASFANSFSTILRVTRDPGLFSLIDHYETNGAEPLPGDLAGVKLSMQQFRTQDGCRYWSMRIKNPFQAIPRREDQLPNMTGPT